MRCAHTCSYPARFGMRKSIEQQTTTNIFLGSLTYGSTQRPPMWKIPNWPPEYIYLRCCYIMLFFSFFLLFSPLHKIYIYQFADLSSLPELNLDLESCRNKFGGCLRDKIIWGFLNVSYIRSFERDLSMKLACRTTLELPFFLFKGSEGNHVSLDLPPAERKGGKESDTFIHKNTTPLSFGFITFIFYF